MDESFAFFLERMGAPAGRREVDARVAVTYQNRLPDKLLEYWQEHGWAGYGDGIFWTVDPAEYAGVLEMWLEDTPFARDDEYFVIARTAFGELYTWGRERGPWLKIRTPSGVYFPNRWSLEGMRKYGADFKVESFFEGTTRDGCDFFDQGGKQLFARALKKLGPVARDECYGFVPALGLAGEAELANLSKVKIVEYLTLLAGCTPRRVMEIL